MKWLSLPHAAEHMDLSVDAFRRMVRLGKLPRPDRSLGVRMPRWDSEALDRAMGGEERARRDPAAALEIWREKERQKRIARLSS